MANETITITQSLDQVTVVSEGPVGLNSGGTISGALNVGVDGTGHDVKFFGDTAGKYMQWDQSADKLFINGELEVNGSATTFNSTVITIDDPIFSLGGQQRTDALDDSKDRGIEFFYHDGAQKTGFMGYDDSADAFTFLTSATNSNEVFSGTAGKLIGQDFLAGTFGKFGWSGDTDTYINNLGDRITFSVGGLGFADFSEGTQDIVHFNYNENQDIDFKVGYNGGTSIFSEGSSGNTTFGGTVTVPQGTAGTGGTGSIVNASFNDFGLNFTGNNKLQTYRGTTVLTETGQSGALGYLVIGSTSLLGFASNAVGGHAGDVSFSRISSGVLGLGTGALGETDGTLLAGAVGINQTSPTAPLHIGGGVSDTYAKIGYYWTFASNTLSSSGALKLNAGSGESIHLQENGTDRLVVKHTTGYVGIGTTSPARKFHVNAGSLDVGIRLESSDELAKIELQDNGGTAWIGCKSGGLHLQGGGSDTVGSLVVKDGNVGIGTAAPAALLDIAGDAVFSEGACGNEITI